MPVVRERLAKDLADWIDAPTDAVNRYAEAITSWSASETTMRTPWPPQEAEKVEAVPSARIRVFSDRASRRSAVVAAAIARLESISGRTARCLVQVAGSELSVDLPLRPLEERDLKPGDRFLWWMSEDGSVAAEDIDDLPPNRLTAAEEATAQRLHEELRQRTASGDPWGLVARQGR